MGKKNKLCSKNTKNLESHSQKEKEFEGKIEKLKTVFFNPSNPQCTDAWDELYYQFLEEIKKEHHEFYDAIMKLNKCLEDDPKMRTIFLLFKKIVPTIDPTDISPLEFLRISINDAKTCKDYSKLCVFIQIATNNLKEIEAKIADKETNTKLLAYRINEEEAFILTPLFNNIRDFYFKNPSKAYDILIVPAIVKHKDYLIKTLDKYICDDVKKKRGTENSVKQKSQYMNTVKEIKQLYARLENYQEILSEKKEKKEKLTEQIQKRKESDETTDSFEDLVKIVDKEIEKIDEAVENTTNKIKENVIKIDILKTNYYHNKYNSWKRLQDNTHYLVVYPARLFFSTSFVKRVFWAPLPWPIQEYIEPRKEQLQTRPLFWTMIN